MLCENLARYGPDLDGVTAWNRTQSKAAEVATLVENIAAVASLADAVNGSDIVCVCLSDDNAVHEVFASMIETSCVTDKLFVDLSTIHPDTAATLSKRLQEQGAEYLGSPSKSVYLVLDIFFQLHNSVLVFGGVSLAKNRQVTLALAGTSSAISKFRPYTTGV